MSGKLCGLCGIGLPPNPPSSSCPRCSAQERLWYVFAPGHGTFVYAKDEDHAWRVAGDEDILRDRSVIVPAFWAYGRLLVGLPEGIKAEGKVISLHDLRKAKSTPCKDIPQNPPIPAHVQGSSVTPDFEVDGRKGAVILVGCGTSRPHLDLYFAQEPEAEVWTMNDERHAKATRHFQIHLREHFGQHGEEVFDLSDLNIQTYTAETFPYTEIRRIWLNSTIDYMLAVADMEGFQRIYMPGFDFGGIREERELNSARYWLGAIEGAGGRVFLSPLFRGFNCDIYGLNPEFKE